MVVEVMMVEVMMSWVQKEKRRVESDSDSDSDSDTSDSLSALSGRRDSLDSSDDGRRGCNGTC